jgi:hypothetical protein
LQRTHSGTPDLQTLTAVLKSLLIENGPCKGELSIVHREATGQGTFPKEVVTCSLGDGREVRLFCKYEMGYHHDAFGHRGGVALESAVYRELLPPLALSTPWLYGVYEDTSSGQVWLVLEYLEESVRVKKSPDPTAMGLAARWIGRFHRASEVRLQGTEIPFLRSYDAEYYLGWARRTSQYAGDWHQRFPWLQSLCESFEEVVITLLSAPPTVIHGEYYPKNILFRDGNIYPVDWESTAIAAGVIDLASLIEAWPQDIAHQCALAYQEARWPDGPPNGFERTLCAAQLYLHFRWLGDSSNRTTSGWRFEQLHSAGRRLGLI